MTERYTIHRGRPYRITEDGHAVALFDENVSAMFAQKGRDAESVMLSMDEEITRLTRYMLALEAVISRMGLDVTGSPEDMRDAAISEIARMNCASNSRVKLLPNGEDPGEGWRPFGFNGDKIGWFKP